MSYQAILDELVAALKRDVPLDPKLHRLAVLHGGLGDDATLAETRKSLKLKKGQALDGVIDGELAKCKKQYAALARVIQQGLREMVATVLPDIDVNHTGRYGGRYIDVAVKANDARIVRLLLGAGAFAGKGPNGGNALHIAMYESGPEVVELLLDAGVDPLEGSGGECFDYPVLEMARYRQSQRATERRAAVIALLERRLGRPAVVRAVAPPDPSRAKRAALSDDQARQVLSLIVRLARERFDSPATLGTLPEPLPTFVRAADGPEALERVRELLWQLVPPPGTPREAWCNGGDSFVHTPFAAPGFIAWEELYWDLFSSGEVWLLEALLDLGLDASQPFGYGYPLTFAFRGGEPLPLLRLLLAGGADPNRGAALLEAVESDLESVQLLLDAGADPNVRHEPGINWNMTALLHLLSVWEPEKLACAQALVAKGADVNALDSDGSSALDYASKREDTELIAFLEKQGALRGEQLKPRRKGRTR